MKYDPPLKAQFRVELRKAFPNRGQMELVAGRAGLKEQFVTYSSALQPLDNTLQELIDWAEANKCLCKMLDAALDENPSNEQLREIAARLRPNQASLREVGSDLNSLETHLHPTFEFKDVAAWIEKLSQVRLAVCRVEPQPDKPPSGRGGYATGFLISPDIVLTNWHVAKPFWGNNALAEQVVLRFDYECDQEGRVKDGREHKLAPDWTLPRSDEEDYDFALLRLESAAANDRVDGRKRKYLKFADITSAHIKDFSNRSALLILQHPRGDPLKLAFGSIDRYAPPRHIYHNVDTMGGSSGAAGALLRIWR